MCPLFFFLRRSLFAMKLVIFIIHLFKLEPPQWCWGVYSWWCWGGKAIQGAVDQTLVLEFSFYFPAKASPFQFWGLYLTNNGNGLFTFPIITIVLIIFLPLIPLLGKNIVKKQTNNRSSNIAKFKVSLLFSLIDIVMREVECLFPTQAGGQEMWGIGVRNVELVMG